VHIDDRLNDTIQSPMLDEISESTDRQIEPAIRDRILMIPRTFQVQKVSLFTSVFPIANETSMVDGARANSNIPSSIYLRSETLNS